MRVKTEKHGAPATKTLFTCPNCGHEAAFATPGSSGFYLAAGLVATAAVTAVMALTKDYGQIERIITAALLAAATAPSAIEALQRRRYPVTGEIQDTPAPPRPSDPVQKGVALLDRFRFAGGFFGVFVVLLLWLTFWGAIGWIADQL